MAITPQEERAIRARLSALEGLTERVERLESIIDEFPDVKRARERAEKETERERKRLDLEEQKAKEKAEADARIAAAEKAEREALKAIERARKAKIDAGLIESEKE